MQYDQVLLIKFFKIELDLLSIPKLIQANNNITILSEIWPIVFFGTPTEFFFKISCKTVVVVHIVPTLLYLHR